MRIRNIMRQNRLFLACLVIVVLSVCLRYQVFAPGPHNAEWNSATVLKHLQIWNQEGGMRYVFNPVTTYPGDANKHIDNHASTEEGFLAYVGESGEYYYTSYPQFGYVAPYLFFKVLLIEPNIIGLRIFGLLVQIMTAGMLLKMLLDLTGRREVALVGFTAYMLMPITLYYHAYNYMSDMLAPFLFVSTTYLFLRITSGRPYSKRTAALFVLSTALLIYTEYLGLFVAGVMLLWGVFRRKEKYARLIVWTSVLAPSAVMLWIVTQYASVGNTSTFLSVMVERYADSYSPQTNVDAVGDIFQGYWKWYAPILCAIGGLALVRWIVSVVANQKAGKLSGDERSRITLLLGMLATPVLLHHVALLHWTAYHAKFFSTLKAAPFLAVCLSLLVWLVLFRTRTYNHRALYSAVAIFLTVILFWSLRTYAQDLPHDINPSSYCEAGKDMASYARPDQVIFVKDARKSKHDFPINPVIVYCAKRNIAIYENGQAARELVAKNGVSSGVIFTLVYFEGAGSEIINAEEINLSTR